MQYVQSATRQSLHLFEIISISDYQLRVDDCVPGVANFAQRFEGDILDFGCGSKPNEALFTRAKSYVGIDIQVSGHVHKDSKVDYFTMGKHYHSPIIHLIALCALK